MEQLAQSLDGRHANLLNDVTHMRTGDAERKKPRSMAGDGH